MTAKAPPEGKCSPVVSLSAHEAARLRAKVEDLERRLADMTARAVSQREWVTDRILDQYIVIPTDAADRLSIRDLGVLCHYYRGRSREGLSRRSYRQIAQSCGRSVYVVKRSFKRMIAAGVVNPATVRSPALGRGLVLRFPRDER